jgi:ferredoxin
MIRITFRRKKCIGCNACVEAAKGRWRISRKDGKSILLGAKKKKEIDWIVLDDEEYEKNKKAADNCPVKIIKVEKLK